MRRGSSSNDSKLLWINWKQHPFSNGNGYICHRTKTIQQHYLLWEFFWKWRKKNPCQIEWMCIVEASRLLRSGRMHNHKMIDEFKCRLRTLYDPDKQTKVKCCSWERTAWTRIWLVEGSLNFCFLYTNSNLSIKSGQFCFENPKTRYNFHLMPNVLVGNNFLFYCSVAKLKPSYMRLLPGA